MFKVKIIHRNSAAGVKILYITKQLKYRISIGGITEDLNYLPECFLKRINCIDIN